MERHPLTPVEYRAGLEGTRALTSREAEAFEQQTLDIQNRTRRDGDGPKGASSNGRRGHWDGITLIAETTNPTDRARFRGASGWLHRVQQITGDNGDGLVGILAGAPAAERAEAGRI